MHLLTLKEVSPQFIKNIIEEAIIIKENPEKYQDVLKNKTLAMLFQKTSTRTRCSFESAMTQLGGHAQYLDWRTTNFTLGDLRDEIKCLTRYVDIIMARVYCQEDLEAMVGVSRVPIINGLSDMYHPCQILGDLMTVKEKLGRLAGLKLTYIGDGNNVCNSLILGGGKVGMKISIACPQGYQPKKEIVEEGKRYSQVEITTDLKKAIKNTNIIYTDTWVSMGEENETRERLKIFRPYQVNKKLMKLTPKALFMHCLPAHRGEEVTDEVIDSKQSIVYDQAENRLHIQKAIILKLLNKI